MIVNLQALCDLQGAPTSTGLIQIDHDERQYGEPEGQALALLALASV
jgi:hypothetical protein